MNELKSVEAPRPPPSGRGIQDGDVVGYRYTIRSDSGNVLAVSAEVAYYLHGGDGTKPPGLEARMLGRHDGELFRASLQLSLAGRTLHFEVSIVSIRFATDAERENGQPIGELAIRGMQTAAVSGATS